MKLLKKKPASKTFKMKHELQENIPRAIEVAKVLIPIYKKGIFGHKSEDMPELLKPKDLEKGSVEHVNYMSLLVALDYMREAKQLWQAGINTYNDNEVKWVFDINNKDIEDMHKLILALQKHKVSKKPEKDARIWQTIAFGIRDLFDGNMKKFIDQKCDHNAIIMFYKIKYKYKRFFPNLSGDKILPLWIRMMGSVCGIKINNLEDITIPVDVHTARATIFTGCLTGQGIKTNIQNIIFDVDRVWSKASEKLGINKLDLDEPLWTLSKYGCSKSKNMNCPVFNDCPVKELCEAVKRRMKVVQGDKGVVIE